MAKSAVLKSGFTLGGEQAEADNLLEEAFFSSSDFEVIISRDDQRCFIVGRTGSGKSAVLTRLEEVASSRVIRISPEDLSLPYITNLQAIKYLDTLEINLDTFWTTLWRHVLLVEIIRRRYNVDSSQAKQNFLTNLRESISRDHAKRAALEYLDEYEGRFWCEADERIREITDKFATKIEASGNAQIPLGVAQLGSGGSRSLESSQETRAEQVDRFQRVVNDTQLARLSKMISVLDDDILDSPAHYTYVVIDDLDREWVDERIANDLVRCLFKTVLDLKKVENLKVLVALRTNIFQQLDFGQRGGGQEEKFRSLVLEMRWTRHDLHSLLDERVKVASKRTNMDARCVADLLPAKTRGKGAPIDYILDRTLLRPRDAIAFFNEILALAIGKETASWDDILQAERPYSRNRLLALRDEWKPTYPGIDLTLEKFRRCGDPMSVTEFKSRMDDVMLLLTEPRFAGVRWLTDLTESMWSAGADDSWYEIYLPLARLLYEIGFLGCSLTPAAKPTFYLDDPSFLESGRNLERCEAFFIHPTYHAAIDVLGA